MHRNVHWGARRGVTISDIQVGWWKTSSLNNMDRDEYSNSHGTPSDTRDMQKYNGCALGQCHQPLQLHTNKSMKPGTASTQYYDDSSNNSAQNNWQIWEFIQNHIINNNRGLPKIGRSSADPLPCDSRRLIRTVRVIKESRPSVPVQKKMCKRPCYKFKILLTNLLNLVTNKCDILGHVHWMWLWLKEEERKKSSQNRPIYTM